MAYKNVFVIADEEKVIGELCNGGRQVGEKVSAVVFGEKSCAEKAISLGADCAYVYGNDGSVMIEEYAKLIVKLMEEKGADFVILSSSVRSKLLAGKIATILDTCVTAGVAELKIEGDVAVTKRMVYGGAAFRTEKLTSRVPVVTIGAGTFASLEPVASRTGEIFEMAEKPEARIKKIETQAKNEVVVNLATAKRVVDLGRGFATEEDLELGRKLASIIGADVGCSRPVAESNGWMPKSRYIGVTGTILKPELCFVIGVSGQVQHLVGINQSKTIVAINKDKNAPIFKNADFGVAGDMNKILPALIEKLS